jgi:3-oxoacyl-[acyl-carrier-protein] synthase III
MEAACTSFIYALTTADKFVKTGEAKCALVIGAECITKIVDWNDRMMTEAILYHARQEETVQWDVVEFSLD